MKFFDFPNVKLINKDLPHFRVYTDSGAPYYGKVRSAVQELARREKHRALAFIEITAAHPNTFKWFNFHTDKEGLPFAILVNWTYGMGKKPYDMYAYAGVDAGGPNASALQDIASMERFVGDFFGYRLQPWLRSEPILMNFSDYRRFEGAFQMVQTQWAEVALQDDVDVLVMFFASWCGFSKRMQPRIDDLARRLGHVSSLRVAKIDLTLNDIKHPVLHRMAGYPFLVMFPAGKKGRPEVIHAPEAAAEWTERLTAMLRPVATHPIPDAPPPASQTDVAGAVSTFRDLQEI